MSNGSRYLLRNTTRYDINLGDIRYRIPAMQTRDLFSKTAKLNPEDIKKSRESGSIAARLKTGALVEVLREIDLRPPNKKTIASDAVNFPRNKKSAITLDVAKLDEKLNDMVLEEEDDLLKELQFEDLATGGAEVPLVAEEESKEDDDSETKEEV